MHISRLIIKWSPKYAFAGHLSKMMDRIAKGLENVKKSVRAADELP